MAANGIWDLIFGAVMGGLTGGFGGPAGGLGSSMGGLGWSYGLGSYDGGGYTGAGSRSGGLDGKGGFLAMLHPDETIIDHTRRRAANGNAPATANDNGPTFSASVTINVAAGTSPDVAPAIGREVTKQLDAQFGDRMRKYERNPQRRKG